MCFSERADGPQWTGPSGRAAREESHEVSPSNSQAKQDKATAEPLSGSSGTMYCSGLLASGSCSAGCLLLWVPWGDGAVAVSRPRAC